MMRSAAPSVMPGRLVSWPFEAEFKIKKMIGAGVGAFQALLDSLHDRFGIVFQFGCPFRGLLPYPRPEGLPMPHAHASATDRARRV